MPKEKKIPAWQRHDVRREKMIETVRSDGEQAELYKVPSMFPGESVYRLVFGGRNYYAPTQAAAHQTFRDLVAAWRGRKAA